MGMRCVFYTVRTQRPSGQHHESDHTSFPQLKLLSIRCINQRISHNRDNRGEEYPTAPKPRGVCRPKEFPLFISDCWRLQYSLHCLRSAFEHQGLCMYRISPDDIEYICFGHLVRGYLFILHWTLGHLQGWFWEGSAITLFTSLNC